VAAVKTKEGVVLCGDTRLSRGYSILSRDHTKIHKLTDKCYLLNTGCFAQICKFRTHLDQKIIEYKFKMGREPNVDVIAEIVSKSLFQNRFFPWGVYSLICG